MPRPTTTFFVEGRWVRRCYRCREIKDLETEFNRHKLRERGFAYECRSCAKRLVAESTQRRREDDPAEFAQRERERSRRYRAGLYADPSRHSEINENRRIDYRLKREREGCAVRASIVTPVSGLPFLLPSQPFAAVVDREIAKRLPFAETLPNGDPPGAATVAPSLGIQPRSLLDWRKAARRVRSTTVDRFCTLTGIQWWEIWPKDQYPQVWAVLNE